MAILSEGDHYDPLTPEERIMEHIRGEQAAFVQCRSDGVRIGFGNGQAVEVTVRKVGYWFTRRRELVLSVNGTTLRTWELGVVP